MYLGFWFRGGQDETLKSLPFLYFEVIMSIGETICILWNISTHSVQKNVKGVQESATR